MRSTIFLLLVLVGWSHAALPTTFGHSISQGALHEERQTIFEYNSTTGNAVITHWWTTGGGAQEKIGNINNAIFKFFIDGETTPSIDARLDLATGTYFDDNTSPWGTKRFGRGSNIGGQFNNFRIPFSKSVRITAELPGVKKTNPLSFYFIIRGAENLPTFIGNFQLPLNARLKLFKNENVTVEPLGYVQLAKVTSPGMILQVTMAVGSGNYNYLEGCFRAYIDGSTKQLLLSSGTEDYYSSAYYFSTSAGGPYHLDMAGLTHMKQIGGPYGAQFSAYRFHEEDPVFFSKSITITWRNGDTYSPVSNLKCVDEPGTVVVANPQRSQVWTYTWVYLF